MDSVKTFVQKWKWPLIVVLAVLALIIVYYMMSGRSESFATGKPLSYYGGLYPTEGFYALQTGVNDPNEQTKLLLFYSPSCHHCKSLMSGEQSVWNTIKQKHNGKGVAVEEYDANKNPELANKFNIVELPTIILSTGDKSAVFKGERTVQAIEQFLLGQGQ